jgi:hypothetical protein
MTINFDLVIDTKEDPLDMKAGLDSMQGVSDALRCIAESVLTGSVPKRQSPKGRVRTSLKKSFKGSYGQEFSLEIYDSALEKKLKLIGKPAFIELVAYFINESLYKESNTLSRNAQKALNSLGEAAEDIVGQLRVSSLEKIHETSIKFNHSIKFRQKISRNRQAIIAKFDRNTAKVLQAEKSDEVIDINISVTRLNIHTGNGRLQIIDQNETVAFGFDSEYRDVTLEAKKFFSENLNHNNGIEKSDWKYLTISVNPIKLKDGKIIKFIVKALR